MFAKDCWYVAAWDHEIEDGPLGRDRGRTRGPMLSPWAVDGAPDWGMGCSATIMGSCSTSPVRLNFVMAELASRLGSRPGAARLCWVASIRAAALIRYRQGGCDAYGSTWRVPQAQRST